MTISKITLLEQLEKAGVKVDVDSYDPVVVKSFPFTPHDATSNQALISSLVLAPINAEMVKGTVISMPGATPIQVLDVLVCTFDLS
jgi:transaldolase